MNLDQIDINTPEHISIKFKIAGLGSRAAAHLIDLLILSIINLILFFSFVFLEDKLHPMIRGGTYFISLYIILSFILLWGYFVLFEFFSSGQTPGKRLVGIRVIQENGQSITFLSALIRNLLRIIDLLPTLYLIGIIMIFFHSKHKRIGDLTAGTIVIYERKKRRKKKDKQMQKFEKMGIDKNKLVIDEWSKKKIGAKEWNLLKTYIDRFHSLKIKERDKLTIKIAEILFPLVGIEYENKTAYWVEQDIIALYLILKDDWEY